jgi:ribosome-binding factor A
MTRHAAFKRADRVGEEVQKVIARMLIEGDLRDARLTRCTITRVKMADDLRDGRVYFSLLGDDAAQAEALGCFNRAAGFIKTEVGHRLQLRHTPNLRFYFDATLERAERISQLLKEALPAEPPAEDEPTDE